MLRSSPNEQTVKFRLAGVVRKLTERTWRASRSSKVTRPRFETVVVVSRSAMNRASSSTQSWQGRAQDAAPDSFPAQSCGSYAIRRARDWWHGRAAPAHGGRCRPTAHRSAIHPYRCRARCGRRTAGRRRLRLGLLRKFSRSPHRLRFRPACTPRKSCRRSCARSPT